MPTHHQRGNHIGTDLKFTPDSPIVRLLMEKPDAQIYAGIQTTCRGSYAVLEVLLPEGELCVTSRL